MDLHEDERGQVQYGFAEDELAECCRDLPSAGLAVIPLTLLTAELPPSRYPSRLCHSSTTNRAFLNRTVGLLNDCRLVVAAAPRMARRSGSLLLRFASSSRHALACGSGSDPPQYIYRLSRIRHKILCVCFNRAAFTSDFFECVNK